MPPIINVDVATRSRANSPATRRHLPIRPLTHRLAGSQRALYGISVEFGWYVGEQVVVSSKVG